jgi:hypothetical protein
MPITMKLLRRRELIPVLAVGLLGVAACDLAHAQLTRRQTLQLQRGWNAVFLEVTPTNTDPATVIHDLPIDIVATFLRADSAVQFIKDPAMIGWKQEGWGVWYAPARPDAFLRTLFALDGNRAYLVHAGQACVWNLEGYVFHEPVRWKADSFNLVGFCLDPQSPPTFEKFFAGSAAHRHHRIYRLMDGHWTLVANPTGTVMRAGEALWVHCRGSSDYQGPLSVKLPAGRQLVLDEGGQAQVVLANAANDPSAVRIETVGPGGGLPLTYVVRGITTGRMDDLPLDLPADHRIPTLEPGEQTALRLRVRHERMTAPSQGALLRFSHECGAQVWVPVMARRADLSSNP